MLLAFFLQTLLYASEVRHQSSQGATGPSLSKTEASSSPLRKKNEILGAVSKEALSYRDVLLSAWVSDHLDQKVFSVDSLQDPQKLSEKLNEALLDRVLLQEDDRVGLGESTSLSPSQTEALKKSEALFREGSVFKPLIQGYAFKHEEFKKSFHQKIRVRNFIEAKSKSFVSLPNEQDLKTYFDANRVKFGSVPFDQVKENIRSFLNKQEQDERFKAWIEALKTKYEVKNFLKEIQTQSKKQS